MGRVVRGGGRHHPCVALGVLLASLGTRRSASRASRTPLTCFRSLVDEYQSVVRRRPSINFTLGSHPSSFLAREPSATRFRGPVVISGRNSILGLCPV